MKIGCPGVRKALAYLAFAESRRIIKIAHFDIRAFVLPYLILDNKWEYQVMSFAAWYPLPDDV